VSERPIRVLLVDNYDSFTHNLAHLFGTLGADVDVVRNDVDELDAAAVAAHDVVCIGPGPGRPKDAGKSLAVIGWAIDLEKPLLGVCLGQQALGEYFGGVVEHAPQLMHGKTSAIEHDGSGVFRGLPSPFRATRYHSLCVAHSPFPEALRANAASEDGVIQGVAHRTRPLHGVQFHPESVLTPDGGRIFANFLALVPAASTETAAAPPATAPAAAAQVGDAPAGVAPAADALKSAGEP
jgi:anthranilate synthase/aminodeoxychorismate synthase-like glutamine amidotransferase